MEIPDLLGARNSAAIAGRTEANLDPATEQKLRGAAKQFEATFLAEMLRHTGIGKMPEGFGGGAGEAAFSGHLTQAYADEIADRGGLGLAEQIYKSLRARAGS